MHYSHSGQKAKTACRPECKFFFKASMKKMHSGILGAKSAFLKSAISASLLSANTARDSYNDS
jgi:hypothetical protein